MPTILRPSSDAQSGAFDHVRLDLGRAEPPVEGMRDPAALALEVELGREQVDTMADGAGPLGGSLHEARPDLILTGEAWR
jgi:hypothetical protein